MAKLLRSGAIQASLRVSRPGDADEREADRVADRVIVVFGWGQPSIAKATAKGAARQTRQGTAKSKR